MPYKALMVHDQELCVKESGVDQTKRHILLGYCPMGPHGQFACLGGSEYLPCSQIGVLELLKTALLTLRYSEMQADLLFFCRYHPAVFCLNYS